MSQARFHRKGFLTLVPPSSFLLSFAFSLREKERKRERTRRESERNPQERQKKEKAQSRREAKRRKRDNVRKRDDSFGLAEKKFKFRFTPHEDTWRRRRKIKKSKFGFFSL